MKNISNRFAKLLLLLSIISLTVLSDLNAQVVKQPLSGVSTTIKHYSYPYILSQTSKKDIEYIIIQAPNGQIKTVFNACDVCYKEHKGYSQKGNLLRCNNCGRSFLIDTLGNPAPPGTCSPGYLPHTIDGDNVSIKVSDLIVGEYFFLESVLAVDEANNSISDLFTLTYNYNGLKLRTDNEADRNYFIANYIGQILKTWSSSSNEIQIPLENLTPGFYILNITEGNRRYSKEFWINK